MVVGETRQNFPVAPLYYLETLWFQVAGTLCNLECGHCLVSANPTNKTHLMMSLEEVKTHLAEAERLGVREFYFTGGEPFMNRDMVAILEATLKIGPANVLTNGTFLEHRMARRLKQLSEGSHYSLELRISLDGTSQETNDPIRGTGSFERILRGIKCLAEGGLNPVITVTEAAPELEKLGQQGREKFFDLIRSLGIQQPRLKILSLFHIGEEVDRSGGYKPTETMKGLHLTGEDLLKLQCTTSRIVTHEGMWVCPILVNDPQARMGDTLQESLHPFLMDRGACYTCHAYGVTCRT
ncbi:MAG: Coenzyme PQQ synthesis protein E [Elusimicrobia bacterium]|nr:Coenzyme PQQ synthesis protein E [Elusimicrobiota bacterium]